MITDDVIASLRQFAAAHRATAVARELERLLGTELTQSFLIMSFKRAFPAIPLRTLIDAGGWHRVSGGGLSDAEFDGMLAEWLPTK